MKNKNITSCTTCICGTCEKAIIECGRCLNCSKGSASLPFRPLHSNDMNSCNKYKKFDNDNIELNSKQISRLDDIDNAVFNAIKVMLNKEIEWNMELIGDIADSMASILTSKGYSIYYPAITTDENGNTTISEIYES